MRIKQKDMLLLILFLLLIIINISLYLNKVLIPTQNNEKVKQAYEELKNEEATLVEEQQEEQQEENEQEKLAQMGEQQRIRYYVNQYLSYLDEKDYEKAYSLLYPEFKDNYFTTLEEYQNYIKEKYPSVTTVTYGEIQRQGKYYILNVTIKDLQNIEDTTKQITQKFIIYEMGYNEFTVSFQVK